MKRRLNETTTVEVQRALFNADGAISVASAKEELQSAKLAAAKIDKFLTLRCEIDALPPTFTRLKHEVGKGEGVCRGNIYNGKCYKCQEFAPGVMAYSFKATICEVGDDDINMQVMCAEGAGTSMFGMTAQAFMEQTTDHRASLVERISNVPITCGFMLKYDPDTDDAMMCIYDINLA